MKMIVAVGQNWGIGKDGGLLCHLPGDLAYFKEKTLGKTVVMGRVTLEGLPGGKGLPGRRNIVLTHKENYAAKEAEVAGDEAALWQLLGVADPLAAGEAAESQDGALGRRARSLAARAVFDAATSEVFIIGGAAVYERFLPYCDTVYVTKIAEGFEADRFFPNLDEDASFVLHEEGGEREENGVRYRFTEYRRKAQ